MTAVNQSSFRRWLPAGFALVLFFLVLGTKWAVFDRFGSDMPNWDQWDAEDLELLAPWFEHDHFVKHLFTPHNEHRVVMTKLQNLTLTLLGGQWDARVESAFNAALHSALAVALWLVGRRWLRPVAQASSPASGNAGVTPALLQIALFLLLALLFGLPIAWQNITGGFHSQQYWLLGLSFAAMVALPFARAWSAAWWAAAGAAVLALFTMGSGMLAPAVVLAVVAWRWLRRDTTLRDAWPTLVLTGTLVVAGLLTRVEVDYHQHMKAKSAHDFVFCILHNLQWPIPRDDAWGAAAVLWLPWVLVTWQALRTRGDTARVPLTIAALGGWVVLQVFATAYARGAGGDFPASRYMDTLAFGIAANALALGWLGTLAAARFAAIARATLGAAWLGIVGWGLWTIMTTIVIYELPDNRKYFDKAESFMCAYLALGDRTDLLHDDIPYPSADGLIERLNHTGIRERLPASIRPPLAMKAATASAAFTENLATLRSFDGRPPRNGLSPATSPLPSHTTWGSFGKDGVATTGEWRSAPLTATLGGWLKFETAGQLGEPDLALELHDAKTDALLASVQPTKIPGDAWRAAYVRAPRGPFVVVARDASATRWLAFSGPVEMSRVSHFAWLLVKNGRLIAECAAVAGALLAFASLALVRGGRARENG